MKATKRALLASALAMLLCVSMLVGTTFAWFTDTASTAVNVIQAGTLDIALEYSIDGNTWNDAEGKTLNFLVNGAEDADILWEPGCTYELPMLRVRNNGNLALKYTINVNGVVGASKLLEVIDFTVNDTATYAFEGSLVPGATSETLTIVGHMDEEAGNQYQGLTLSGLGITVFATQETYETDSIDNNYDAGAELQDATQAQVNALAKKLATAEEGSTIVLDALNYGAITLGSGSYTYDTYAKDLTIVGNGGSTFTKFAVSGMDIEGWTFEGITFTTGLSFVNGAKVNNLTIDGCTFANCGFSIVNGSATNPVGENLTIKNCEFINSDDSAILVHGMTNVTIDNNVITGAEHNAIQTSYNTKGAIVISNNEIKNCGSRAIRISLKDATTTIDFVNNTVVGLGNVEDSDNQLVKISGTVSVDNLTFVNNTWNTLKDSEIYQGLIGADFVVDYDYVD